MACSLEVSPPEGRFRGVCEEHFGIAEGLEDVVVGVGGGDEEVGDAGEGLLMAGGLVVDYAGDGLTVGRDRVDAVDAAAKEDRDPS